MYFSGADEVERAVPGSPAGRGWEQLCNMGATRHNTTRLLFPLITLGRLPGSSDCGCGLVGGEISQAFGAIGGKGLRVMDRRGIVYVC